MDDERLSGTVPLLCRRIAWLFALSALIAPTAHGQETGLPLENEEGRALALEIFKAAGGDRWKTTPGSLVFDFINQQGDSVVMRVHHSWDPLNDRYRVSGSTRDGRPWLVDFSSLSRRESRCTIAGQAADDSVAPRLASLGFGRHINDCYWLMMPVKLLDDGVHHARLADTIFDDKRCAVLTIWFDNVGLTPGDRYWVFVDSDSHEVVGWRYRLQSGHDGIYRWEGVKTIGPLRLPTIKRAMHNSHVIRFEVSWELPRE